MLSKVNPNSLERWPRLLSSPARAAVTMHIEMGGNLDQSDFEKGMTVERLNRALQAAIPNEPPPSDALSARLALLEVQLTKSRLSEDLTTFQK